jgi:hypothetical protein
VMGNDSLRIRSSCVNVGISPLSTQYESPPPSFCFHFQDSLRNFGKWRYHAKLFKLNARRCKTPTHKTLHALNTLICSRLLNQGYWLNPHPKTLQATFKQPEGLG